MSMGNIELAYVILEGTTWHGEGKELATFPNSETMMEASGLNWDVGRSKMYTHAGIEFPGREILYRTDNLQPIGSVSTGYQADSPRDLFSFGDSLVADQVATWSTAGTLYRGALPTVWASMKVEEDWTIADEEYKPYVFMTTDYDGKVAFTAKPTAIRVVCANTHAMALEGAGTGVNIRHNAANRDERLADARTLLTVTTAAMNRFKEWAEATTSQRLDDATIEAVQEILAPTVVAEAGTRSKAKAGRENIITRFRDDYLAPEVELNGFSRYSLWNASTGYLDYGQRLRKSAKNDKTQARTLSTMFGTAARAKRDIEQLLTVA